MPAPINYLMDVQSPIQAAVQGLQFGGALQKLQADRELAAQQQADAQAKAQQQQQLQADLGALAANPNPTARDYAAVMAKYPQLSEQYKRTYDVMNAEQQQNKLSQATQVYAALQADQPEIAQQLLNEQATAARNSGLEEDAKAAETMAKLVKLNPATAKTTMGLGVAAILGPEKFGETFKTLGAEQRATELAPVEQRRIAAETAIKETEAQYAPKQIPLQIEKLGADIGLTQAQIEQAQAAQQHNVAGTVPPEKRVEAENKMRKEYVDNTKSFQEVSAAYSRIQAAEPTAAGDIALIFNYMKMLDPGSVVREGEFATAQNAAGIPDRIQNIYNKLLAGERLNESQRKSFNSQAGKMYDAAGQQEKIVRTGIERIAKSYGLNTDNVFYEPSGPTRPTVPGAAPPPPSPAQRSYMRFSAPPTGP
jgi:hypothetical protein